MYHLDANAISAMMRDPHGRVGLRARPFAFGKLAVSVIVVAELRFGIVKRGSIQLGEQLKRILGALVVEPVDEAVATAYAHVRSDLERIGQPIGSNDTWIAAHALALDATLVTANEREFRRVRGLKVENWAA